MAVERQLAQGTSPLRWVAVLPGALLGGLLVGLAIHWAVLAATGPYPLVRLTPTQRDSIDLLARTAAGAFAAVWLGARIAPARPSRAALVVALVLAAILVLYGGITRPTGPALTYVMGAVAGLVFVWRGVGLRKAPHILDS